MLIWLFVRITCRLFPTNLPFSLIFSNFPFFPSFPSSDDFFFFWFATIFNIAQAFLFVFLFSSYFFLFCLYLSFFSFILWVSLFFSSSLIWLERNLCSWSIWMCSKCSKKQKFLVVNGESKKSWERDQTVIVTSVLLEKPQPKCFSVLSSWTLTFGNKHILHQNVFSSRTQASFDFWTALLSVTDKWTFLSTGHNFKAVWKEDKKKDWNCFQTHLTMKEDSRIVGRVIMARSYGEMNFGATLTQAASRFHLIFKLT